MTEEWRDIPGWEGLYQASSLGRIRSVVRAREGKNRWGPITRRYGSGRILKHNVRNDRGGYWQVTLSDGGKRSTRLVHRLVCEAFKGGPPHGRPLVAHLNGNPADNRPENLVWATAQENQDHRKLHGTDCRGGRNPNAKFAGGEIPLIRERAAQGESNASIARSYSVRTETIWAIVNGVNWKHVA